MVAVVVRDVGVHHITARDEANCDQNTSDGEKLYVAMHGASCWAWPLKPKRSRTLAGLSYRAFFQGAYFAPSALLQSIFSRFEEQARVYRPNGRRAANSGAGTIVGKALQSRAPLRIDNLARSYPQLREF